MGNFLSVLGAALAQALIGRLLGPDDFGLFSLAVVAASIFQLFVGLGAGIAVTRYVADYVSKGELERAREFTKNAVAVTVITGALITVLVYAAAPAIAQAVFRRPPLAPFIRTASFAVLGQGLFQGILAASIGWNAMGLASASKAVQSFGRALVAPALVLAGAGTAGAVAGHVLSFLLTAVAFAAVLFLAKVGNPLALKNFAGDVRLMVSYGFPAFLAFVLNGLSTYYVSVVLSVIASSVVIGYFQAAWNFTVPVTLLSNAVTAAFFPAFAVLRLRKGDTAEGFRLLVKYLSYVAVPLIFFIAGASTNLMFVLYGKFFAAGAPLIALLALTNLPIVLGFNVLVVYLNGVDRTRATLAAISAEAATVFVLAPLLGGYLGLGVDGLVLAVFLSNMASTLVGLALIGEKGGSPIDFRAAALVVLSALLAMGAIMAVPPLPRNLLPLVVKFVVFVGVYVTAAPALGAITPEDLEMIGRLVSEMKSLRPLVSALVKYQEAVYRGVRRRPASAPDTLL